MYDSEDELCLQEESLARAKEEDEKRKEVTGRFQVSEGRVNVQFIRL